MAHLVSPIYDVTVQTCFDLSNDAHTYLAKCGADAIQETSTITEVALWGTSVKRKPVNLRPVDIPDLIGEGISEHSLTEVINQCATMERLLDALQWAMEELPEFKHVVCCHPTTSSVKRPENQGMPDNDLVLENSAGELARFEVSDVASDKDGNRKEFKDLISLGVLSNRSGEERYIVDWPRELLYLVVSSEFSQGLLKRRQGGHPKEHAHYHYAKAGELGSTCILEVRRGAPETD